MQGWLSSISGIWMAMHYNVEMPANVSYDVDRSLFAVFLVVSNYATQRRIGEVMCDGQP